MKTQILASPAQVRMARAGLKLTFTDLAARADVSTNTLTRIEAGESVRARTMAAIQGALEAAGVEFVHEPGRIGIFLKQDGEAAAA